MNTTFDFDNLQKNHKENALLTLSIFSEDEIDIEEVPRRYAGPDVSNHSTEDLGDWLDKNGLPRQKAC